MVDFRSDTVTKPSAEMLDAMFSAKVGDDVFGEDIEVNKLQNSASQLFGFDEALFCPSGTMANQIAIKVHTQPGDELICNKLSHIYHYEGGGIAFNAGVSAKLIGGESGLLDVEELLSNINPDDIHFPKTSLVVAENTCNKAGGSVYPFELLKKINKVCKNNKLAFHLDGARIFNALQASGDDPHEIGKLFDSASVCLSKGLGCPVGSVLLGSSNFIKNARRIRKVLGGGMRQAGFLAAAGTYALNNNIERLSLDHKRALVLKQLLENLQWVESILPVYTNIVVVKIPVIMPVTELIEKLKKEEILVVPFGKNQIRFVTHLDINDKDIEFTIDAFKRVVF
jgi:threonine aldolase